MPGHRDSYHNIPFGYSDSDPMSGSSRRSSAPKTQTPESTTVPIAHIALASREAQRGMQDASTTFAAHAVKKYQVVAVVIGVVVFLVLIVGVYFLMRSLILKQIKKYAILDKKTKTQDKSGTLESSIIGYDGLELGLIGVAAAVSIGFTFLFIERKKFIATTQAEAAYHHATRDLKDTDMSSVSLYGSPRK